MTVFIDDMYLYPMGQFGRMKMSHLIADTDDELHAMAQRVGVARKWWQNVTSGSHYDICMSAREKALEYGATPITLKQCAIMNMRRRKTGELGTPDDSDRWAKEFYAYLHRSR